MLTPVVSDRVQRTERIWAHGVRVFDDAERFSYWLRRNVYCADRPATAMLEMLVHFEWVKPPRRFHLLTIELPDAIEFASASVRPGWHHEIETTRSIGSALILDAKGPVLAAPSVIVPHGIDSLLSPALVDAALERHARIQRPQRLHARQ